LIHLLLINGWSANADFWGDFSNDLPDQFELQVIDLNQEKTLGEWLEVIDQNVTNNTLLMGWSLGGAFAIQYAAISKKPFLGLITLQTNPCFIAKDSWPHGLAKSEFEMLYDLVLQSVESGEMASVIRRFSHLLVDGSLKHKGDRRNLKKCYSEITLANARALLSGLVFLCDFDLRQVLPKVSLPSLHLFGEQDALVAVDVSNDLKSLTLNSDNHKVLVLGEMAHLPCFSHRVEVISTLEAFVETL